MTRINYKRILRKRVPILQWLPEYTLSDASGDLIAGFTVGLTLIPQAIAYASLANLGPQYGLYSAFVGSLIYIVFGTCKEVNIGPTALISLLTFTYARGVPEYAALLCFLSGCVTIILGILRLGFLVEFVSAPVVTGFTSAASLIIACSQIKGLLGLKMHGETFLSIWQELSEKITETLIPDLILSVVCITILLTLRKVKDLKVKNAQLDKFLWFLGVARNAIVVVACAIASYIFERQSSIPYTLTGEIDGGFPKVEPPPFSLQRGNSTIPFLELCKTLGSGIIIVPLISIIGNVAIAKAFAQGKTLDATQELLTLGLCNIVGSFFHSMPVTGSFSRSAVNNTSGVKTPLGGLYTGALVILSLTLLTPYFYYIPRATLSSVIISAVIFMVEVGTLKPVWECSKRDLIPLLVTFIACLFAGVELGIVIGVAVDLIILIYFSARPTIRIEYRNNPASTYILVRPSSGLLFPAVDYLRSNLTECDDNYKERESLHMGCNGEPLPSVVLDCKHFDKIDYTAAEGIAAVIKDFRNGNRSLMLLNAETEILRSIQSLSKKPIVSIKSDQDLPTFMKEHNAARAFVREDFENTELSDRQFSSKVSNHNSTHL